MPFRGSQRPFKGGFRAGQVAQGPQHAAEIVDADRHARVFGTECLFIDSQRALEGGLSRGIIPRPRE